MVEEKSIDVGWVVEEWLSGRCDLVCVLGPTASGKTRYAVRLAHELERTLAEVGGSREKGFGGERAHSMRRCGEVCPSDEEGKDEVKIRKKGGPEGVKGFCGVEIISADSRQVYRGMDIGTGKDLEEYGDVPYHLIDIVPAGVKYNIYEYQRDFEAVYTDTLSRGAIPLLCGGSGLYIETVTQAYSLPDVPANPELRAELERQDTESLIEKLASLKKLHNSTDYDTRQRLIRALEIAIYEQEHPVRHTDCLPKNTLYIGISVSREERNRRIDERLDARLGAGLVEEVQGLLAGGLSADDLMYYGLEYKYVTLYLTGQLSYAQMREKLAIAIHQFAKRQMTWFRGMERRGIKIHWVEFAK